ncbi:hypothetical protein M407DRAFT_131883 [Tulasnella calospora MUT 4182]|uniref:Uncharacterized protein n=1 Tax=Tulasnella calospora MUT 4182 TaxID=1051891 RepID=A0A0C3KHR5_9AGAM|nr:hypothetical protein M407DRAFT_131883 [Tulasnella calospora MUT 4182]
MTLEKRFLNIWPTCFEKFCTQGYTLYVTLPEVSAFGSLSRMLQGIVSVSSPTDHISIEPLTFIRLN